MWDKVLKVQDFAIDSPFKVQDWDFSALQPGGWVRRRHINFVDHYQIIIRQIITLQYSDKNYVIDNHCYSSPFRSTRWVWIAWLPLTKSNRPPLLHRKQLEWVAISVPFIEFQNVGDPAWICPCSSNTVKINILLLLSCMCISICKTVDKGVLALLNALVKVYPPTISCALVSTQTFKKRVWYCNVCGFVRLSQQC